MSVLFYVSALLTALYALLILCYGYGWLRIPYFKPKHGETPQHTFSILVPARNEEQVIATCLRDLVLQDYPAGLAEVIVINDHSTDRTAAVVEQFIALHDASRIRIRLLHMQDDKDKRKLKKAAITYGITHAMGDYIILTDADCERGSEWLRTLDAFIAETKAKLVYAPVAFKAANVFQKVQAMEFAGLVGIGAAAIRLKNPNMCSAANLLFEKKVFDEVGGYTGNDGLASGDDEFLMHKVFRRYPDEVLFLKNRKAIVSTSANSSVQELADQRRRWVSKSTKYENRYITAILVGAYVFNASVLLNLFIDPAWGWMQLLIKTLVEGLFLFSVLRFFKRAQYLLFLPVAELFHILYVLIIGIWANMGSYNWKGRNVK